MDLKPVIARLDDAWWERFQQLSGGATAACFQCGVCTAICPWGLVREQPIGVRRLLRAAQLGFPEADRAAWLCTACAECEQACPRQVPIAEVFRSLRGLLWEQREIPPGLPSVLWSMHWNHNPWSQPPSQRTRWAEGMDLPRFDPQEHEILLYVGCTASYDPRGQRIARALIHVLRAADVAFGVFGEDEPCCGEAALALGHRAYFEDIAQATAASFREHGVRRLVTVSPHAYDVFQNHYPSANYGFRPMHYASFLTELLEEGRLVPTQPLRQKAAYHDPCLLGRRHQLYEEPRRLLEAIPALSLVEMEHNRSDAICCGGGGGRMWMETPPGERFSDLRIQEAEAAGADLLVTACTFCAVCLEDSLRATSDQRLQILDLAEVVALTVYDRAALA